MPGLIDNELTIEALNQAIVALNEINVGLPGGVDTTIIENNLALAAQKIDDVRVVLETQSTAEIVGQNTNFQDLIGVLSMLNLVCQSIVNVSPQSYFEPIEQPSDPGGEGIPAPQPFEELELLPEIAADRRCFMANKMVDEIANWFDKTNSLQLDEIANIGFTAFMALWIAGLVSYAAESALLASISATVSAVLPAMARYAYDNIGLLEFSTVHAAIIARRDDLVCALFEAQDCFNARGAFDGILVEEGIDVVNRGFVANVLQDHYLNHLWYRGDDQAEAEYSVASGYSCDTCDDVCANRSGNLISDNGSTIELGSVFDVNDHAAGCYIDATEAFQLCGGSATVSNFQVTSGQVTGSNNYRLGSGSSNFGNLYWSNVPPPNPVSGVRSVYIISLVPFTISFDYVAD